MEYDGGGNAEDFGFGKEEGFTSSSEWDEEAEDNNEGNNNNDNNDAETEEDESDFY